MLKKLEADAETANPSKARFYVRFIRRLRAIGTTIAATRARVGHDVGALAHIPKKPLLPNFSIISIRGM